ncbi:hypothetical protein PI125_g19114 [Phytophthora idaei]|nr:hypothetical protein PI125_g19114 [Phytophthora idaei]
MVEVRPQTPLSRSELAEAKARCKNYCEHPSILSLLRYDRSSITLKRSYREKQAAGESQPEQSSSSVASTSSPTAASTTSQTRDSDRPEHATATPAAAPCDGATGETERQAHEAQCEEEESKTEETEVAAFCGQSVRMFADLGGALSTTTDSTEAVTTPTEAFDQPDPSPNTHSNRME